jgi:hypothetical protein
MHMGIFRNPQQRQVMLMDQSFRTPARRNFARRPKSSTLSSSNAGESATELAEPCAKPLPAMPVTSYLLANAAQSNHSMRHTQRHDDVHYTGE